VGGGNDKDDSKFTKEFEEAFSRHRDYRGCLLVDNSSFCMVGFCRSVLCQLLLNRRDFWSSYICRKELICDNIRRELTAPRPFAPVKLICGIIASHDRINLSAEERLVQHYGAFDSKSQSFPFDFTNYYEKQMGKNLKRKFVSFANLIEPERLSAIKLETNRMEEEIREEFQATNRVVNLDPGFLTLSALIMATAKDFSHRVPLQNGIYAHLELLFGRDEVRMLDWTYPDFKTKEYQEFFLKIRRNYLSQLRKKT
jgi:hypothetical protein